MDLEFKKLKISAIALITGNAVVDDLWQIYFPLLIKSPIVCREIMISAHGLALMNSLEPIDDFIERVGQETRYSRSSIVNSIAMLRDQGFLENVEIGKGKTAVRPSSEAKVMLIEMGIEYASRMHYPLSVILGVVPSSPASLVDDIVKMYDSSVADY